MPFGSTIVRQKIRDFWLAPVKLTGIPQELVLSFDLVHGSTVLGIVKRQDGVEVNRHVDAVSPSFA